MISVWGFLLWLIFRKFPLHFIWNGLMLMCWLVINHNILIWATLRLSRIEINSSQWFTIASNETWFVLLHVYLIDTVISDTFVIKMHLSSCLYMIWLYVCVCISDGACSALVQCAQNTHTHTYEVLNDNVIFTVIPIEEELHWRMQSKGLRNNIYLFFFSLSVFRSFSSLFYSK